jgi:hypothetical protein
MRIKKASLRHAGNKAQTMTHIQFFVYVTSEKKLRQCNSAELSDVNRSPDGIMQMS